MSKNYIRVLGSADWHATGNNDHSCYTIDDKILIDACPSLVASLQAYDVEPAQIPVVCFTHMHIDHCMGLPPLLHHWRVCNKGCLEGLTIIGPKASVRETVMRAMRFVFGEHPEKMLKSMPKIIEAEGDMQMDIPGYQIQMTDSDHAVPGLCYRITNTENGHVIGLSGDTAYLPKFGAFFANADLLVHECSYGGNPAPVPDVPRHSGAPEAVRVCNEANVKNLLLTHTYEPKRAAAMTVASDQLSIPVNWAMPGKVFSY